VDAAVVAACVRAGFRKSGLIGSPRERLLQRKITAVEERTRKLQSRSNSMYARRVCSQALQSD
jgi:hypothetical protein